MPKRAGQNSICSERKIIIMNDIKICVLGGDMRQIYAAREMCKKGYEVTVYGLEGDTGEAVKCTSLQGAISGSRLILLPLPYSTDGIRICSPLSPKEIRIEELCLYIEEGQVIAGGKLSNSFCDYLKLKECEYFDYYDSERLTILNAIPTAEGALAIALNEMKTTLFGSKTAILGYGRIGRVLARMLNDLNSEVTVFARSDAALAWAEAEGCHGINICDLSRKIGEYELVINTIPFVVLNKKVLEKTNENTVFIDLASKPGGIDFDYAKRLGRRVFWALSLPGKTAPITAGKIIAECIMEKLKETEKK